MVVGSVAIVLLAPLLGTVGILIRAVDGRPVLFRQSQGEDFDQRVELDLDYIDRWSMRLDLEILVRTIPAMIKGR